VVSLRKAILITGAGGFLGKELTKQLLKNDDYSVIAVTSQRDSLLNLMGYHPNLRVIRIEDLVGCNVYFDKSLDIAINCAFPRTSDPCELAKGVCLTEQLTRSILKLGVGRLINISSQSVYSQKAKSVPDEDSQVCPESLYGMAKLACERVVAIMCQSANVGYSNIRMASLFGVEFHARVINRFVRDAVEGRPITVYGGTQKVSYLTVEDAALGIIAMVENSHRPWSDVYNLGSNQSMSLSDLAEVVRVLARAYITNEVSLEKKEAVDDFSNLINSRRFFEDFNWQPKDDIEMMVRDSFEYYSRGVVLT
jgi:nucleoside-diphosphate-sugar epimerase